MTRVATAVLVTWLACATTVRAGEPPPASQDFAGGLAALIERDFTTAEARFRVVLQVDPNSHEAHNNLAVALGEEGRDEEAAAELQAAIRLRPDYDRARQNLAAVYVRLAARQLLTAAEQAEPPQRQALAEQARGILIAGPHLPPVELLARADQLASAPPITPAIPSPVASLPAATATPTATATAIAIATAATTPTTTDAKSLAVVLEPVGAELLVINTAGRRAALYRRESGTLKQVGSWSFTGRGSMHGPGILTVMRRSEWSLRLLDPTTRETATWAIESASKSTKSANAAVLSGADYRAATASVRPGRDVVAIVSDAREVKLDIATADQLRDRLEEWRRAREGRDVAGYEALYAATFTDERHRPRAEWLAGLREAFASGDAAAVQLQDTTVVALGDEAVTTFELESASASERTRAPELLMWSRRAGEWLIVAEDEPGVDASPGHRPISRAAPKALPSRSRNPTPASSSASGGAPAR